VGVIILAARIGAMQTKIGDLDFPALSTGEREMVLEVLTSLKGTVDEVLGRAAKSGKRVA
jgi:hypothetical protein